MMYEFVKISMQFLSNVWIYVSLGKEMWVEDSTVVRYLVPGRHQEPWLGSLQAQLILLSVPLLLLGDMEDEIVSADV